MSKQKSDKSDKIPSISEFVAEDKVTLSEVQDEIIFHIFRCDAAGSFPHTVLFSVPQDEIQRAIEGIKDYVVVNKEKVAEIYKNVTTQYNLTSSEDVTSLPDEMLRDYFANKVGSLASARPVDFKEINSKAYVLSAVEVSMTLRNNLISKVLEKADLAKTLSEYGVSTDYRPSVEVLEIAVLSALIANNLKGSTSLWTPGKQF